MKKFIIVLHVIFICSCTNKSNKSVRHDPIQFISEKDEAFLVEVGSKLNRVPKEELLKFQALKSIEQSDRLFKKTTLSKGDKYSALALLENLKLYQKDINDSKTQALIKLKENQLRNMADGVPVRTLGNDVKFPSDAFENRLEIPSQLRLSGIPAAVKSSLSYTKSISAWFYNENTSYDCGGITVTNPNPNGDPLTATDHLTRRTEELVELANRLQTAENIYKYVRDEIYPWYTFGATQSAHQVAQTKVGTFIDKATLLISLLRAKGISAQYLLGDVLVPEDKLKGIWGVEGKYDLYWAFSVQLGMYWDQPNKGIIFYKNGERNWLIPHAWVRAYIDGKWIELDPSNIYYEYGAKSPAFKQFSLAIDYEKYLTGQNQSGQYEKAGTIIDFVLETAGDQLRSVFGAGINVRDLDLAFYGKSIIPEIEGIPVGTMGYNGSGCVFNQENLLPSQFQAKFNLKIKKGTSTVFEKQWDSAEFLEKGLTTRHTGGLLGRVGSVSGNMNLYLGTDLVGSIPSKTTDALNLDYYLEYGPKAYNNSPPKLGTDKYAITAAGDVYAFMAYNAPTSSINLESEIRSLKKFITDKVEESIIYGQFLRVANVLTVLKEFEQNKINNVLNTAGSDLRGVFYTYGKGGIVKDRADRPYGAIPLGTGINWYGGSMKYSRSGNYTEFSDYVNLTNHSLLGILYCSQIEANIWEILYGVPGGSSTKLLQLIAKDTFVNGKENILVSNKQLGIGNEPQILAEFDDDMIKSVASDINDEAQGYVKYKSILFSHKRQYVGENGFKGLAVLILPTDPRVGAVASYNGQSPAVGGIGPNGGGSIAGAVAAKPVPVTVDANDPERKGSATSCNPVSYSTGDMFHDFTDFAISGRTPGSTLKFERKYSTKPFKPLGDLGPDWTHNFQTRLISEGFNELKPELPTNIIWIKEGGNKVVFSRNVDGTFSPPAGVNDQLVELSNEYTVKRKGGNFYSYAKNKSGVLNGRLLYFKEVHGEKITLNYDSNKRLYSVESPFAGSITFTYDGVGRIVSVYRDRDELNYTFTYNSDGYLSSSSDFENNKTKYEYVKDRPSTKAQNLLAKIIDPLNQEIAFEYYDDGRVFQEIGKGGAKSTYFYSYFLVDQLTRMKGENGATKIYKFDDQYRLIETEYEDGSRSKQVWDNESNMSASIDELGYETKFIYDKKGNKIGVKTPEHSGYIRTEYHPDFDKPTKQIPLLGAITVNTYDPDTGDLVKTEKQDSLGSTFLEFTNDQFGNVLTTRNNYVSYSDVRDGNGFLTEKYDSRNPVNMEYDSRGRVIRQIFESGKILDFEYDNFDRVTKTINNVGPDVQNQYDVLGRLISKTITDGITSKTSHFEYDARDRQVAVTDPLGRKTLKKYDIPGLGCKYVIDQPVEIIDPKGRSTKFAFDSRNRLVRSASPDGTVTRREYNDRGDLIGITDGSGNRTAFVYDGNGRMIRKERASSKSANNGEALAAKEITTYKYDEADRLIREEMLLPEESNGTEVAMLVTEFNYNELGQQIKKVIKKEFMGQSEIFDESNFVYRRVLDGPVQLQANNQNSLLEFIYETTPPFSLTGYKVKASKTNNPLGLVEGEYAITPDLSGQVKILEKDGLPNPLYENEYDPEGRITQKVSRFNGHRLITNFTYDSFGRKKTIVHDNGHSGTFSYDVLDRLISSLWNGGSGSMQETITYELLTGNITKIQREIGNFDYTYDGNDQLLKVVYSGNSGLESLVNRDLAYDRAGNRLSDTISGNGTFIRNVITENAYNRYYTDPNGFGNIVQKTNKQNGELHIFDYLTDGKIRKFTKYEKIPNSTKTMETDYYYDALGRRIAKKIKMPSREFTQTFAYLGNEDKILFAKKGNNEVQMQIDGQGIDEHLGEIALNGIKTFSSDHLGTLINGEIVTGKKNTGAFGEVLSLVNPVESGSNPVLYGFTGRQFDQESGLYYYRNRYYDPQSGRFMSKDPKGIEGGDVNLYRYVGNSPIISTDPEGLWTGSLGTSLSVTSGGFTTSASFNISFDGHGNLNFATTVGAGAGVGLPGAQWNILEVSGSNADNINQLKGPGFLTSGNLITPAGVGGSVGAFGGNGYQGFSIGGGVGTPGGSFSNQITATGLGGEGAKKLGGEGAKKCGK